jgi:hypothetical protein
MARARNNITKLSWDSRLRICELLDDGVEYDDIRHDADIAAECAEKSLTIHNSTFLAYSNGPEYVEYRKRRRKWADDFTRRQMAARMIDDAEGSDSIAKAAEYELMRKCIQKLESGDELEPKELSSISNAVASYNRNRIAENKEDTRREADEKETIYRAEIAKLSATIEQLTGAKKSGGLSPEALQKIEEAASLL